MSLQFLFVALVLASFSVTRLVTTDSITEPFRMRVLAHLKAGGWFATLITCSWCMGFWVSAAIVFVVDRWYQPIPLPVAWAFAIRVVVGIISDLLGLLEGVYHATVSRLDPVDTELRRALTAAQLDAAVAQAAPPPGADLQTLMHHAQLERVEAEARKAAAEAAIAEADLARRTPPVEVQATQPCDGCGKELTRGLAVNGKVFCPDCSNRLHLVAAAPAGMVRRAPAGRVRTIVPRDGTL